MAQEVTSGAVVKKIDGTERDYRTITTHENGKIQKTVYQQEIDKSVYEQRKLTTPTLVAEGDDGLYYVTVRTETRDASGNISGTDSIYADLAFQQEYAKNGGTSLKSNLNAESAIALAKNTDKNINHWKAQYSTTNNVLLTPAIIEEGLTELAFNTDDIPLSFTGRRRTEYENLYYPEDIVSSEQDRIRFSMRYISGNRNISFFQRADGSFNPLSVGNRTTTGIQGSVTLPITGGIQDKNSVKYDAETLNVFQAAGAAAILNPGGAAAAAGQFLSDAITKSPDELQKILASDDAENIVAALRLGLAQSFTGGNLLSRVGGGVLNPNMELLFQGPTLRTFNFSFTMSARSRTEATQIKKIIRFFKQGMSVKKSNNNIFVVSPNIFNIQYKTGDGRDHPSIGRIKNCALLDLNTTYGNGNTYMTYDDRDRTMTQYKIDMTFQELDPITEDDYGNFDEIVGTENFLLRPTIENEVAIPDSQIGF
jgi:hypothetical protein|tara:strand:- start:48 stop:1490 length:1443 start_codon:yes stop_codon:yes gene_type:complete